MRILIILLMISGLTMAVNPPNKGPFPKGLLENMKKNILPEKWGDPAWVARMEKRKSARTLGKQTGTDAFVLPVVLADFKDNTGQISAATFQDHLFDNNPTGTMTDYYDEISYGQFSISGTVYGWVHTNQNMDYYTGNNNGNGSYPNNVKGFVHDVAAQADAQIDFTQYDNDGPDGIPNSGDDDGYVDALAVVYAGAGADWWPGNSSFWPHMSSLGNEAYTTNDKGINGQNIIVSTYFVCPEESGGGSGDGTIRPLGVFVHEFGHVLGLPDLYDRTDASEGPDFQDSEGVGNWCLMAGGSWGGDGAHTETPSHMSVWCKYQMGWLTPVVITQSQTNLSIPASETSATAYMLWEDGYAMSRYWLVENRQKTGFDKYLTGSGLLVFHVDENRRWGKAAWSSGPVNDDETHKLVDLEEADGLANLDNSVNRGDSGDPFPGSGNNTTFDDNSTPSARDYDGNPTGMSIRNISTSATVMTADFTPRKLTGYGLSYDAFGLSGWGWGYASPADSWGGVRYTADYTGEVAAVDIAFREQNTDYTILVYDGFNTSTNKPGNLYTSVSGTATDQGWYTLELPQTMPVDAGQTFFIAVKITGKSYAISFDPYGTLTGRSYFSSNGTTYDNNIASSGNINLRARVLSDAVSGWKDDITTPRQLRLAQNFPNPFNPATTIEYDLPGASFVTLEVFDVSGRRVGQLVNEQQSSGAHRINFNGDGLASGVYIYRLSSRFGTLTRRMLFLK